MQHPLENPSLTPFGFVFSKSRERLRFVAPPGSFCGDRVAARFWTKANRLNADGARPAEVILHEILPSITTSGKIFKGDFEFDGKMYLGRDIAILSTFMQWFGTNVGHCFLTDTPFGLTISHSSREFTEKLRFEKEWRDDTTRRLVHTCNNRCTKMACAFEPNFVTARDRLVVGGLMHWLGRLEGRAYLDRYLGHRKAVEENKRREYLIRIRQAA